MNGSVSRDDLVLALVAAASAHHEYEDSCLSGEPDERWAGWYAAYALGRLGDFAAPGDLTRWLESAPPGEEWSDAAADHVMRKLGMD